MSVTIAVIIIILSILILGFRLFYPYHKILSLVVFLIGASRYFKYVKIKYIYILIAILVILEIVSTFREKLHRYMYKHTNKDKKYWNNIKHRYKDMIKKDFLNIERLIIEVEKYLNSKMVINDIDEKAFDEASKKIILEKWMEYISFYNQLDKLELKHRFYNKVKKENKVKAFFIYYTCRMLKLKMVLSFELNYMSNDIFKKVLIGNKIDYKTIISDSIKNINHLKIAYQQLYIRKLEVQYKKIIRKDVFLTRLVQYLKASYFDLYFYLVKNPKIISNKILGLYENIIYKIWNPIQKKIPLFMSYVRLTARENLISYTEIDKMKDKLKPGDIILTRRNWKLTNSGIPGFWVHSALYTGSLIEMKEFFNRNVEGDIERINKDALKELKEESEYKVIESIRPGVVLRTIEQAASSDFLVVFRPKKLDKEDIYKAVLKAFEYYSKPYDYYFDFYSNDAFICSELIVKSYETNESKKGINFDKKLISGRLIVPTNNIIKKFDKEYGTQEAELDFVLFYEGDEKARKAYEADIDKLRGSWKKKKVDMFIEKFLPRGRFFRK